MAVAPRIVLGPAAFGPALEALAAEWARATGRPVALRLGPAGGPSPEAVTARLARGEPADVAFLPQALAQAEVAAGRVDPDSLRPAFRSVVALCVRAGAIVPDVSTPEALAAALRAAPSIGYSAAGSGVFVSSVLFAGLGVAAEMAAKAVRLTEEPVGAAVARGAVALGFQQLSELLQETGIAIAGPLPEMARNPTTIALCAGRHAGDPAAARDMAAFLATAQARAILSDAGLLAA